MSDFFEALADPDVAFVRYALVAGVLASVAFGVMGSYVVVRRITYAAGAISHCVLGGIGAALYLQYRHGLAWCDPMAGAVVAALLAAVAIGLVSLYAREREDTVIGAIWAGGMAVGLLFLAKTPGYGDAMGYLFGNILLLSERDLWLVGGLDTLVVGVGVLYYHKFQALCFDDEFAQLRGLRVRLHYLMLLGLVALAVVLLVRVVGIVLVIALLTLPPAAAGHFARHLWQMMALAIVLCAVFVAVGLGYSYAHDLPSGPVIVIVAAVVYAAVAGGQWWWRGIR